MGRMEWRAWMARRVAPITGPRRSWKAILVVLAIVLIVIAIGSILALTAPHAPDMKLVQSMMGPAVPLPAHPTLTASATP